MSAIAVIDYDMGNLHSACKGLQKSAKTISDAGYPYPAPEKYIACVKSRIPSAATPPLP